MARVSVQVSCLHGKLIGRHAARRSDPVYPSGPLSVAVEGSPIGLVCPASPHSPGRAGVNSSSRVAGQSLRLNPNRKPDVGLCGWGLAPSISCPVLSVVNM